MGFLAGESELKSFWKLEFWGVDRYKNQHVPFFVFPEDLSEQLRMQLKLLQAEL